jgi:hypothetical protein
MSNKGQSKAQLEANRRAMMASAKSVLGLGPFESTRERRKAIFPTIERLLRQCDGDYNAAHAAIGEYRDATTKAAARKEKVQHVKVRVTEPDLTPIRVQVKVERPWDNRPAQNDAQNIEQLRRVGEALKEKGAA